MGYIYKIENLINHKIYIGQTTKERPTDRFSQHRYLARHPEQETSISYLHRAMNKYGVDNFSFEIIEEIEDSSLNEREQYWIREKKSLTPNGYNMTVGGEGTLGYSRTQSKEEKMKRSKSAKKFYENNPEAIEKLRERTLSLWQDDEYRKRVTESNKKFYSEHPDKFKGENNPMYGKHHTEEALEKIRKHAATRKIKIAQLDKDTLEIINIYDGIKDAEKALGVSHGWISKAAKQDKVAYGYKWKLM